MAELGAGSDAKYSSTSAQMARKVRKCKPRQEKQKPEKQLEKMEKKELQGQGSSLFRLGSANECLVDQPISDR